MNSFLAPLFEKFVELFTFSHPDTIFLGIKNLPRTILHKLLTIVILLTPLNRHSILQIMNFQKFLKHLFSVGNLDNILKALLFCFEPGLVTPIYFGESFLEWFTIIYMVNRLLQAFGELVQTSRHITSRKISLLNIRGIRWSSLLVLLNFPVIFVVLRV